MSRSRYLSQAQSNENAARSIETVYPDWTVTMCFYTALYLIEYYASQKGVDIQQEFSSKSPHDARRGYVLDLAEQLKSRTLRRLYDDLEEASQKARYLKKLKYENAIDFFKSHKSEVEESFQKLQQIKDILKISYK